MYVVKLSSKGQLVLPASLRQARRWRALHFAAEAAPFYTCDHRLIRRAQAAGLSVAEPEDANGARP